MARELVTQPEQLTPREVVAKQHKAKGGANLVRLASRTFDPKAGVPSVPAALKAATSNYWLVQVEYPATKETRLAIEAAGAEILSVVPEVTYLVRASSSAIEQIRHIDRVRWAGAYEPAYKLSPSLDDLKAPAALRVWSHEGVDARTLTTAVRASGAKVLQAGDTIVSVTADQSSLNALARIEGVQWIDRKPEVKPYNNNALWVTNTAERDNDGAALPGRLDGVGQTAAVADTGINYIPDDNGRAQKAFSDCNAAGVCKLASYVSGTPGNTDAALKDRTATGSNHRKMAGYFNLDADDPNARSLEGSWHGTHVSGSVAGDYPEADGTYGTRNREADGIAVGARLIFQDVEAEGGLGGLPGDPYDLFNQVYDLNGNGQYDPNEDARTHNNSYGAIYPLLDDGGAQSTDQFVRDHPDMMIVFSASNDGPDPGTLAGGPQESKNIITSCASANGRQPLVSMDAAAIFSSHGPTIDGRLKPDVCTPGQINVSPKGGTVDDDQYLQGTSMSGPMLVGLVTLVRQYFWDGFGPTGIQGFARGTRDFSNRHNPSAALVKATTINSAQRMRGYYTGDDGGSRDDDGMWPSNGQGWGKVELDQALYFPGDDKALFTVDRPNDEENGLSTDGVAEHFIDVAPGQPLNVTLTWTDPASPLVAGTPTLVNDLDLVVIAPDGTEYLGNEFNTQTPLMGPGGDPSLPIGESVEGGLPDRANNVEGVRIQNPAVGQWTVRVSGTNVAEGFQGFALAVSGRIATDQPRIQFDAPKYKSGAKATAYLMGTGLTGDTIGGFTKVANSIYTQEVTATGSILSLSGGGASASVAVDDTGPAVSNVLPNSIAADLTFFTWDSNEKSTGQVIVNGPDGEKTFGDVYAVESFPGLTTPQNETKGNFQNKLVNTTKHEAYVTGLKAGVTYTYKIKSVDEAGNESISPPVEFTSTAAMYAPNAPDIGMLLSGDLTTGLPALPDLGLCGTPVNPPVPTCQPWGTSTQLYAGSFSTNTLAVEAMPAFMFRLPSSVDPTKITGAAVELYSGHDIVDVYTDHTIYSLDMLDSSVEGSWGGSTGYSDVNGAKADVEMAPDPSLRRGANKAYAFQVPCNDLEDFKTNLAEDTGSERRAAFRLKASTTLDESLFSFETGYGRRSRGPQLRPRLILFMDGLDPMPCTATTAPKISNVAVDHTTPDSAFVSWRTDVDSDSTVYFRKVGATDWTPVSAPVRTTNHFIKITGLEPNGAYEFTVRSTTCNGQTTDDTNGGKTYALFNSAFVGAHFGAYYAKPSINDPATEIVGWGSDQPTTSTIKWGTSPSNLDKTLTKDDGEDEATDTHVFELPDLTACTRYYFQVSGKNESGKETVSPIMAFDRPPDTMPAVATFDFETGPQGFIQDPIAGSGDFGIPFAGESAGPNPTIWEVRTDPGIGSDAMRTVLDMTGQPGYSSNMDLRLISPDISVPSTGFSALEFTEWINLEGVQQDPTGGTGPFEEPMVEISIDGGGWKRLREGLVSQNPDFPSPTTVRIALPSEAAGKSVKFAFRLRTDTNLEPPGGGWAIDDVKVLNGSCSPLVVSDPSVPLAPDESGQQLSTQAVRQIVGPVEPVDGTGAPVGVLPALISPPSAASLAAGTCRCTDIRFLGQSVTAAPGTGGATTGGGGPIPATGWGSEAAAASLSGLLLLLALTLRRRIAARV